MSFGSQTYPRSRSRTRRTLASSQRKGVDGAVVKKKAPITASRGREDRWTTRQDDDSLQAHWAKHGPKYNHYCKVIVAEGGSDIANVSESQPDDSKPFWHYMHGVLGSTQSGHHQEEKGDGLYVQRVDETGRAADTSRRLTEAL